MFGLFGRGSRAKQFELEALNTRLAEAATGGDLESVRAALDQGAAIDGVGETGPRATALMAAALNGNDSVVTLLLSRGANLLVRDELGSTALHYACVRGTPATVKLLLEAGANPSARDKEGAPPQFDTVLLENTPVLYWWLTQGLDAEARNETFIRILRHRIAHFVTAHT